MAHAEGKSEKPNTTLPGTVQKIIKPVHPNAPEQAEIVVENAEELIEKSELKIRL